MIEGQAAPKSTAVSDVLAAARLVVIEPKRVWSPGLSELWQYRQLVYFLSWRDLKVRYKQTFFGAAWAVLQPLLLMGVFGLFFGRLAGVGSENLPYPVFALAALVPWTLFSNGYSGAAQSVVRNNNLVSKVYFPRLAIPVSAATSFLLDFVLATGILIIIQAFFDIWPSWRFVLVPFFGLFALLIALALGIWLAALNVRYRDVVYVVPFLTQALILASPIGYSSAIVPEPWHALYGLNPLAGLIEGFRWSSSGANNDPLGLVAVSIAVTTVGLLTGLLYYGRTQRTFADMI